MKTKSKRFSNLATLCLALLGTTLLTTQPVKAEGVPASSDSGEQLGSPALTENQRERKLIEEQYFGKWAGKEDLHDPYYKGKLDGYIAGYEDGRKTDSVHPDIKLGDGEHGEKIQEPNVTPYFYNNDEDKKQEQEYKNGYGENYGLGYYDGWSNVNPIRSTLEWLWREVSYWFSNFI
ncbi:TPA: hypothetical protein ACWABO_000087 [Streptococcus pyogenes]